MPDIKESRDRLEARIGSNNRGRESYQYAKKKAAEAAERFRIRVERGEAQLRQDPK